LCATWDVDVRIVSSWGTSVESICPDLTADFGGKIAELVESLWISHCVVVGGFVDSRGVAALAVEYLSDVFFKRVGEREETKHNLEAEVTHITP
jgi:hypothetical protein